MKKIILILMTLAIIVSCSDVPVRPVSSFLKESKAEYCPDRRVNIYDIEHEQKGKVVTLKGEIDNNKGLTELVSALENEGYTVANKVRVLPDQELEGKIYGVIDRPVANIRVKPAAQTEMATQAVLGTAIRIYKIQDKGSDRYVQTPDNYLGWIEKGAYTPMTPAEFNDWHKSEKIIYLEDAGYVYQQASSTSAKVSDITAKSLLKALAYEGDYVKVEYPGGRRGYVKASECQNFTEWKNSVEVSAESVIELAHTYMGRPYLWGGTSTKMMDCSGYVRTIMFLHGIYLPRDASQQALVGKTVALGNQEIDKIKSGDLLFFGRFREDGSERITHVGLYIGDSKFIHEAGDVNIMSLDPEDDNFSSYRYKTLMRAQDVINHIGELGVKHISDVELF
ncbi:MAG: C40 family peptidase [Candidatus Neomarinimicrobiota bacterium]